MNATKRDVAAFVSGLVFAIGLVVSGMSHPSKVLAFLDVTGAWDPSLAAVMAGAIAVAAPAFWLAGRRRSPAFDAGFSLPPRRAPIGADVVGGAAIFGVGWGLSGLCPGPAIVALAGGTPGAFVFVVAMLAGSAAVDAWRGRTPSPAADCG